MLCPTRQGPSGCKYAAARSNHHRRNRRLLPAANYQAGTGTANSSSAAVPAPGLGLLGIPSISSPKSYLQHWQSAVKPRLDAIWGSILRTSNPERLLFGLDALLMQLRSSRSLAVHIQQQHEDPAWAQAASQVRRQAIQCVTRRSSALLCTSCTIGCKTASCLSLLLCKASSTAVGHISNKQSCYMFAPPAMQYCMVTPCCMLIL